jgi:Protein of unknown function (DUF1566)
MRKIPLTMTNRLRFAVCVLAGSGIVLGAAIASRGYGQTAVSRYDVQTDVVRDLRTRLTWQRLVPADKLSLAAAGQYCADLNLGGHDDWRLPSMQEFQTIVDEGRNNPAIDPAAFPNTPPEGFWTGTLWAGTTMLAWHADFDRGSAAYDNATMPYRTRCVRWEP